MSLKNRICLLFFVTVIVCANAQDCKFTIEPTYVKVDTSKMDIGDTISVTITNGFKKNIYIFSSYFSFIPTNGNQNAPVRSDKCVTCFGIPGKFDSSFVKVKPGRQLTTQMIIHKKGKYQYLLYGNTKDSLLMETGHSSKHSLCYNLKINSDNNTFSQNLQDSLIIGSWELTAYETDGNIKRIKDFHRTLSFFKDSIYMQKTSYIDTAIAGTVELGMWYIFSNYILKEVKQQAPAYSIHAIDYFNDFIFSVSDTSLILLSYDKGDVQYTHYSRALRPEDRPEDLTFKKKNVFHIEPTYKLVNSFDSTRKITLSQRNTLNVRYENHYEKDTTGSTDIEGFLHDIEDSLLIIRAISEKIEFELANKMSVEVNKDYFKIETDNKLKKINIKDINYIEYISPGKTTVNGLGTTLMSLSAVTMFVVAPLASINFKNKAINPKKYFNVAGAGLIGFTVSIPIIIYSQGKSFSVTKKGQKKEKEFWYLEK